MLLSFCLASPASASLYDAWFGFDGHVKLGHWVPVKFLKTWTGTADSYAIETIDGDESPVIYSGKLQTTKDPLERIAYVRFGKTFGNCLLYTSDAADE